MVNHVPSWARFFRIVRLLYPVYFLVEGLDLVPVDVCDDRLDADLADELLVDEAFPHAYVGALRPRLVLRHFGLVRRTIFLTF